MAIITKASLHYVNLAPATERKDSIQSFVSQETILVVIRDADGFEGIGYTYTIGTGGSAVVALLRDTLLNGLRGRDGRAIEAIFHDLVFSTHATTVGAVTSLAMAAIDTALWDLRAQRCGMPLSLLAGGAHSAASVYTSESGWLNLSVDELVTGALDAQKSGMQGTKIKVGKASVAEDLARLRAVRDAVGDKFDIMIDCNQAFCFDEALRRAHAFEPLNLTWIEEPMPATDLEGHVKLAQQVGIPVAVGESLYDVQQFGAYMRAGACSVVQVDVARVGGITPWLKVAHAAESFNLTIAPHFLMELHLPLVCATRNSRWVEYIPQLGAICRSGPQLVDGFLHPSDQPGLGIDWDWQAIKAHESYTSWTLDLTSTSGAPL